jgi:hypothetical protein
MARAVKLAFLNVATRVALCGKKMICPPSRFALLDIMLDKLLDIKKICLATTRQMLYPT